MAILERRFAEGLPTKVIEEKVDLYPQLHRVYMTFWELNSRRTWTAGGTPLGIPLPEIKAWVELFPVYDIKEFVGHLLILDRAYLQFHTKKTKEQQDAEAAKDKPKR
jgi:hypothetical protein